MQLLKDVRPLWQLPMGENDLLAVGEPTKTGRKPQFSVMLLNCAALGWKIDDIVAEMDAGHLNYAELMYEMKVGAENGRPEIAPRWNCLERCDRDSASDPLHRHGPPALDRDQQPARETLDQGTSRGDRRNRFISKDFVEGQIRAGFVRPSVIVAVGKRCR